MFKRISRQGGSRQQVGQSVVAHGVSDAEMYAVC